jgi:low temperature requirement protein LtrA
MLGLKTASQKQVFAIAVAAGMMNVGTVMVLGVMFLNGARNAYLYAAMVAQVASFAGCVRAVIPMLGLKSVDLEELDARHLREIVMLLVQICFYLLLLLATLPGLLLNLKNW